MMIICFVKPIDALFLNRGIGCGNEWIISQFFIIKFFLLQTKLSFPTTFIYVLNRKVFIFLKTLLAIQILCVISERMTIMSEECDQHDKLLADCGPQGSGDCSMEGMADSTRPGGCLLARQRAGDTRTRGATATGRRTPWRISMPGWRPWPRTRGRPLSRRRRDPSPASDTRRWRERGRGGSSRPRAARRKQASSSRQNWRSWTVASFPWKKVRFSSYQLNMFTLDMFSV